MRVGARGVAVAARAGLKFPLQPTAYVRGTEIAWVEPTYHAVHNVLTHPAYAGAYTFGRTRQRRSVDADGALRVRRTSCHRRMGGAHHRPSPRVHRLGYLPGQPDLASAPTPDRRAHQPGTGAVREGCALLQGLATCGTCGRKLAVYYDGPAKTTPGYYCTGTGTLVEGKGTRHLRVGGADDRRRGRRGVPGRAAPAALQACLAAAQQLEDGHDAALGAVAPPGRAGPL